MSFKVFFRKFRWIISKILTKCYAGYKKDWLLYKKNELFKKQTVKNEVKHFLFQYIIRRPQRGLASIFVFKHIRVKVVPICPKSEYPASWATYWSWIDQIKKRTRLHHFLKRHNHHGIFTTYYQPFTSGGHCVMSWYKNWWPVSFS